MIDNKKTNKENTNNFTEVFGSENAKHFAYGENIFKNKKDLLCFAYYLAKDKRSHLTDITILNTNPQEFDGSHIFPRDMFRYFYRNDIVEPLIEDGISYTPLPNTFDEFYNNYAKLDNSPITIAFSLDDADKKRVNLQALIFNDKDVKQINEDMKDAGINIDHFIKKEELLGSAFNFEKGDMEYMMSMFAEIVADFVMNK